MTSSRMAQVASLVGDPARANILIALMDGRALTASELAFVAGVSAQTTSGHLWKLMDSGLLALTKQGRHRYYRLASREVARMLEQIMIVAGDVPGRIPRYGPRDEAMRTARTCYDHLAGRLAVGIADALSNHGHLVLTEDGGEVTQAGRRFLEKLGIDADLAPGRRPFCRTCLDWTERRPHLAGKLGAAIATHCLECGWVERERNSRALKITRQGQSAFG